MRYDNDTVYICRRAAHAERYVGGDHLISPWQATVKPILQHRS